MADLMHSCTYIRVTCSSSSFSYEVKHRKRRVGGGQLGRDCGDGLTPVQQRGRGRDLKHRWRMAIRRLWIDVWEVGLLGGRHRSRQRINTDRGSHRSWPRIGALLGEAVVTGPGLLAAARVGHWQRRGRNESEAAVRASVSLIVRR